MCVSQREDISTTKHCNLHFNTDFTNLNLIFIYFLMKHFKQLNSIQVIELRCYFI